MAAQTAVSDQRLDWMLATLLEKITERGGSVSNRVKTLLTRFDLDNSGELEMDEFRSCLEDFWPACRTANLKLSRSASTATGLDQYPNTRVHGRIDKACARKGGERRLSSSAAASVAEDYEYATTASLRSAEDRSFRI